MTKETPTFERGKVKIYKHEKTIDIVVNGNVRYTVNDQGSLFTAFNALLDAVEENNGER